MAARSKYYYEDSVCISHGESVYFGVITENDEYISSDDEDFGGDKSCEFRPLQKGEVRVAWHPSGREVVMSQKMLKLADRSIMPADPVRRIDNKRALQCGYCIMSRITADVEIVGNKLVLNSVPSTDLTSIEGFQESHAVVLDSWAGVVVKIECEVIVKASDGSKFIIPLEDAMEMVEMSHCEQGSSNQFNNSIYPKQVLSGQAIMFRAVKWIHKASNISTLWKSNPEKTVHLVVEKVRTKSVTVNWHSMGFSPSNDSVQNKVPPPYKIEGALLKKLKMLKSLDACYLQIGDKKYYQLPDKFEMIATNNWKQKKYQDMSDIPAYFINHSNLLPDDELTKPNKVENGCDESVETVNQNSTERSVQQPNDSENCKKNEEHSSEEEDVDNGELGSDTGSASSQTNACEKSKTCNKGAKSKRGPSLVTNLLKKKRLKRAQKKEKNVSEVAYPILFGGLWVVVEVLNTETVVDVMWQDGTIERDIPSCELYPIINVEDHEYFPGDFVVESKDGAAIDLHCNQYGVVQSVNYNARIAQIKWLRTQVSSPSALIPQDMGTEEVSVYDLVEHPDFNFRAQTVVARIADLQSEPQIIGEELSPAGQVISISLSGMIEIEWSNGKRSMCYPQELQVLGEYDSDDSMFGDSDDSSEDDSDSSWETESSDSSSNSSLNETKPDNTLRKTIKLMQCVVKLSHSLENFVKTPLVVITRPSIKKLLDIFKRAREIDSKLGMTHFDTDELKTLAKQMQDRKFPNQSKLEKLSELFDIPSDSVPNLCEDLAKLKSSWDEDAKNRSKSTSSISNCTDTTPEAEIFKKTDSVPEASASSDASTAKYKHSSRKEIVLMFILKLRHALIALSKDLKVDAEDQSTICQSKVSEPNPEMGAFSPHLDDELIFSMEKHCQELDQTNMSLSSYSSLFDAASESSCFPLDESDPKGESMDVASEPSQETKPKESSSTAEQMECSTPSASSGPCQEHVGFILMEDTPDSHFYKTSHVQSSKPMAQFKAIKKEWMLLKNGVPDGILVKGFEDRMDLLSVMIKGPTRTPYEDGLFFFDLQLPANYPSVPPICHYISFCTDRLNPNLYEEGKVCVSLLGTWGGKGTEVWTSNSTLLQLIISIQGLILVPEPYYNEPGHEAQRNTTQGKENSRMYNEMAVLKLTQSMTKLLKNLPHSFIDEIKAHYKSNVLRLIKRFERWLNMSESWNKDHPQTPTSPTVYRETHADTFTNTDDFYLPEFPLLPASKGFCLSLRKALSNLKESMRSEWPSLEI